MIRRILTFILLCRRVFKTSTDKTNATFFRKATQQRNAKDQRPSAYHWLPGYERLLIKLAVLAVLVAVPIWWFTHDAAERVNGGLGLACLVLAAVWMGTLAHVAGRKHTREVVTPLQHAVDNILGEAA